MISGGSQGQCDANLQSNHKMPEDGFATCSGFSTVISIFLEFCPWVTCTKHITPAKRYFVTNISKGRNPKILSFGHCPTYTPPAKRNLGNI